MTTQSKIVTIGDKVVVKPEPAEERTQSGIVLPETAKEKPQEGTVIAVGTGRVLDNGQRIPLEIKVGDRVFYPKYSGNDIKIGQEEYVVLEEKQIIAIKK